MSSRCHRTPDALAICSRSLSATIERAISTACPRRSEWQSAPRRHNTDWQKLAGHVGTDSGAVSWLKMEGPNDRALLDDLGDSEGTSSRRQRRSFLATLDLRPSACQQRVWQPALWRSGRTKRQSIGPVEDLVRFEPPKPLSALKVFVASYVARQSGHRQVDVSHRGGKPGFVRIGPDGGGARCFQIPD